MSDFVEIVLQEQPAFVEVVVEGQASFVDVIIDEQPAFVEVVIEEQVSFVDVVVEEQVTFVDVVVENIIERSVSGDNKVYVAGENLVSHIPIVLVGGLAYKMNHLNPLHQFAFIGFSRTSSIMGGQVVIETVKIDLAGWGLLPNQTYMAGADGALITTNNTPGSFSKIVGFSQSSTTMLIVKDYTSINKN